MDQLKVLLFLMLALMAIPYASGAAESPPSTVEITVEKDDFLISICNKYLENPSRWSHIAKINRLPDPNRLKPGQKIVIPTDMLKGTPLDGSVTFIKGTVTCTPGNGSQPQQVHLGSRVKPGSEVRTAAESSVEISYEDGTAFLLRDNSSLSVKGAKKTASHYLRQLFLSGGRIISRIKSATGRGSRNEIRTPSAVAEARGTVYRVSVDDRQTTRSEVLEGTIDVSTKAAIVSVKENEGTVVRINERPASPRKLLPPPEPAGLESVIREVPFRISLRQTEGAARQGVIISRDADGKDVVKETVVPVTEELEIDGLEDGSYTLRTFGLDDEGLEGMPSAPMEFKVRVNPLPPIMQSPSNGEKLRSPAVELVWLKVGDAVKYHLQLASDKEFAMPVIEEPAVASSRFRTGDLPPGTYYFRARSIAEDGYVGKWSVIQEFTILPPPPAPSTEKPEVKGAELNLRWAPLSQAASYHVQISPDEGFAGDMLVDEKVDKSAISIPSPKNPGTYFVRVRGIEKEGRAGDFSKPQSFTIEKRFPYWSLGLGVIPLILLLSL